MIPSIVISGNRQSGKTHAALTLAYVEAASGKSVCYLSDNQHESRTVQERLVREFPTSRVCRVNGDLSVQVSGGGIIRFMSYRQTPSGMAFDTIVDETSAYPNEFEWTDWVVSLNSSNDPRIIDVEQAD